MKQSAEIRYDPETNTRYETNVVYGTCPNYPMCIYPSMHLRWHLLQFMWKEAPMGYEWRHVAGPCAFVVSLIGAPGDFLVDTIYLNKDLETSKTNKCIFCNEFKPKNTKAPVEKKKAPVISFRQEGNCIKVDTGGCKVKMISVY
jgi:hypothetical protein